MTTSMIFQMKLVLAAVGYGALVTGLSVDPCSERRSNINALLSRTSSCNFGRPISNE